MDEFYTKYRFIAVPLLVWTVIQLFKVIYELIKTKKWNWKRIWGDGGMPSAHSAVVVTLACLIAKSEGITSPIFALSLIFSLVVMYDAAGVRRAVGKQARVLNDILNNQNLTSAEKLQEMTGHTPIQVAAGAIIGLIVGLAC